jgi:hypothetical protein
MVVEVVASEEVSFPSQIDCSEALLKAYSAQQTPQTPPMPPSPSTPNSLFTSINSQPTSPADVHSVDGLEAGSAEGRLKL